MFGDLFSQRYDNELGMLYSARRKFLLSAGNDVLEPPEFLKTKKQAKKKHSSETYAKVASIVGGQGSRSKKPNSKKAMPTSVANMLLSRSSFITNRRRFKSTAKNVLSAVHIDHYASTTKEDWDEVHEAGVHMWVHKELGDVVTECPYEEHHGRLFRSHREESEKDKKESNDEQETENLGTGSLVYESELDDLFKLLDTTS